MGCIEILRRQLEYGIAKGINRNMGCIEMIINMLQ